MHTTDMNVLSLIPNMHEGFAFSSDIDHTSNLLCWTNFQYHPCTHLASKPLADCDLYLALTLKATLASSPQELIWHFFILSEKAMAPHSSTLAWKIPWTEEPSGLRSMGSLGVGHDWATSLSLFTFMHWRRKWQPTPVFLAWRIPGTGKPGGLPSMGSHRVRHDWSDLAAAAAVSKIPNFSLLNV